MDVELIGLAVPVDLEDLKAGELFLAYGVAGDVIVCLRVEVGGELETLGLARKAQGDADLPQLVDIDNLDPYGRLSAKFAICPRNKRAGLLPIEGVMQGGSLIVAADGPCIISHPSGGRGWEAFDLKTGRSLGQATPEGLLYNAWELMAIWPDETVSSLAKFAGASSGAGDWNFPGAV